MTKKEAARLFGNQQRLADALGITTQAITKWPETLDLRREDWVRGAAVRLQIPLDLSVPTQDTQAA